MGTRTTKHAKNIYRRRAMISRGPQGRCSRKGAQGKVLQTSCWDCDCTRVHFVLDTVLLMHFLTVLWSLSTVFAISVLIGTHTGISCSKLLPEYVSPSPLMILCWHICMFRSSDAQMTYAYIWCLFRLLSFVPRNGGFHVFSNASKIGVLVNRLVLPMAFSPFPC